MIKIYYNISTKIQKKSESIAKSQIVPSPLKREVYPPPAAPKATRGQGEGE
jgi:hypothetical protein